MFKEQVLPSANDSHSECRLDLIVHSPLVAGAMCVDLTVVSATSVEALAKKSATVDGAAARIAGGHKTREYPNCATYPFPVEDLGRVGDISRTFAKMIAPSGPERSAILSKMYQGLGSILQRGSADAILAATAR